MKLKNLIARVLVLAVVVAIGNWLAFQIDAMGQGKGQGKKQSIPAPVPKTGQTICYDNYDFQISDCTETGQDGDYQMGVPWPEPRFTDNENGTVTDNMTGLKWTQNANLANGTGGFQWALDFVKDMNDGIVQNFGYTDWRLPNVRELMSLIDYGGYKPVLPLGHPFTNVQGGFNNLYYHTSTTHCANKTHTYCVSFYHGDVTACNKLEGINDCFLWPVRGGRSATN